MLWQRCSSVSLVVNFILGNVNFSSFLSDNR